VAVVCTPSSIDISYAKVNVDKLVSGSTYLLTASSILVCLVQADVDSACMNNHNMYIHNVQQSSGLP
jgi:hypothetical protein